MAALTDHLRRDAEHAARNFVSTSTGRVTRRWNETDKTQIRAHLEAGVPEGVDEYEWGIALGNKIASENAKYFFDDAATKAAAEATKAATKLLQLEEGARQANS